MLALGLSLLAQAQPGAASDPSQQPIDLVHVASVVGAARGPRLTGESLEAEAKRIGALLRCPVCQGLSVADSPATMATNMRQQVRDMVAAGFVEEQVLSYFEASYGEFVRLRPPLRGVNWLVWLAPLLGLLAGGAIVFFVLRRPRAASLGSPEPAGGAARATTPGARDAREPGEVAEADPLPEDAELARLVLRIREIAYGWPGGVRPQAKGRA
jgi:cytochrome c-type biogenesis protein CcmH